MFLPVPEPKTIKNRIHLDVSATDGDQDAEVERLLALGARRVDIGQGDVSWVVLADPEGNEFCVLEARRQPERRDEHGRPQVLIDCADRDRLAAFWCAALGWKIVGPRRRRRRDRPTATVRA